MKLTHEKIIVLLYVITLITSISSRSINIWYLSAILVLTLSAVKFFFVFFQFMDMKHANPFWKTLIVVFLLGFTGAISIILNL